MIAPAILLLLAAAGSGGPAMKAADCSDPLRGTVDVEVVRQPTPAEFAEAAPRRTELRSGRVTLDCTIGTDGRLTHCAATDEVLPAQGWVRTALQVAARFQFKTTDRSGASAAGRCIRIPLTFNAN